LRAWDFGDLPATLTLVRQGARMTGYPALVDDQNSVSLTLLDTPDAAETATRKGVARLIALQLKSALAQWEKGAPGFAQSALALKTTIPTGDLLADVMRAVADRAFIGDDPLPRDARAFAEQVKRARTRLPAVADAAFRLLASIAAEHHALSQRLASTPSARARFVAALTAERDALVYPGFFAATPWTQLNHLPRYLKALERRLARHLERPDRDARHMEQVTTWTNRYRERAERERAGGGISVRLAEFRWLLEELKVSLFAQELRTPYPVSLKRVEKAWAELSR
jgi:ATP-dependent helicase HrpA